MIGIQAYGLNGPNGVQLLLYVTAATEKCNIAMFFFETKILIHKSLCAASAGQQHCATIGNVQQPKVQHMHEAPFDDRWVEMA